MNKLMKTGLILFAVFMASCFIYKASTLGVQTQVFNIFLETGGSIGFQLDDERRVILVVASGNLSSNSSRVVLEKRRGTFYFTAQNDTELKVEEFNIHAIYNINYGTDSNWENQTAISISKNDFVRIRFVIKSFLDQFFNLGLGLGGLGMMIGSPAWAISLLRKKGFEAMERVGLLSVCFIIGVGLVIIWLW